MKDIIVRKDLIITEQKTAVALIQDVSFLNDVNGSLTDCDTNIIYCLPAPYPPVEYDLYFRVNTKELVLYAANPHGQKIKLDVVLYFDE